jgi:hypothetical protein
MKRYIAIALSTGLLPVGLMLTGCGNTQSASSTPASSSVAGGANLVVNRTANFGGITTVTVSVDGKKVGTIPRGQVYRGQISPGQHVIKAEIEPNFSNSPPSEKRITAQAGKTYTFTATWKADAMVLVQD